MLVEDTPGGEPTIETPIGRPEPEGLVIEANEYTQNELSDTSWLNGSETYLEKHFTLIPRFHGEMVGSIAGTSFLDKGSDGQEPDCYFHLADIQVLPTVRQPNTQNQGIGTALLEAMEQQVKKLGALRIEGDIAPEDLKSNPSLKNFYEKLGYQATYLGIDSQGRDKGYRITKPLK